MPFFIFRRMESKEFTQIQEIGFTGLIEKFKKLTGSERTEVLLGIGDDAAVTKNADGKFICTSSEIFLEGVHFDVSYTPFHHLGYKIVTAAVSDIYAMNAEPNQILINIAIPNKYSVELMEDLYRGFNTACKDYNVQITGGDSTASHSILAISVTALGFVEEENLVKRSGAKEGDLICVTGDLGAALAGLRILMREKKYWQNSGEENFLPDLSEYQYVVQRQLLPKARTDFIQALNKSSVKPGSMIDVTQGVINEIQAISKQSDCGATIYSPAIPISFETRNVADEMKEDVDKYAFYGGEDFEMLFTLEEHLVEKLKTEFEDFSVIGKIEPKENHLIINTGEDSTIKIDLH